MQKLNQAMSILNRVAEDNTTPRNIRRTAKQASDMLIDETRTRLWNIISVLEGIRD